jgi:hypothetical protein
MKEIKNFEDLRGCTLESVVGAVGDDVLIFTLADGRKFQLYHSQSCCESVNIEDITGDLSDLVGEVLFAEESTSSENPDDVKLEYQDSFTWTFYRIGTIKGTVVVRWYGESNGYYSESVDFCEVGKGW